MKKAIIGGFILLAGTLVLTSVLNGGGNNTWGFVGVIISLLGLSILLLELIFGNDK